MGGLSSKGFYEFPNFVAYLPDFLSGHGFSRGAVRVDQTFSFYGMVDYWIVSTTFGSVFVNCTFLCIRVIEVTMSVNILEFTKTSHHTDEELLSVISKCLDSFCIFTGQGHLGFRTADTNFLA